MKKRMLITNIPCVLIISSVIPMTAFAGNNTKTPSVAISSEKDEETEEILSGNHSIETDKNLRTKENGNETDETTADDQEKENPKKSSTFSSIELTEKERQNEKAEKGPAPLRTEVSFFGLRSPRRFTVNSKEENDAAAQSQNITVQNTAAYEEVTVPAYDTEVEYDYGQKPNTDTEYIAPVSECPGSPNGHHSWTDMYEWYNGEQLINSGTSPAGGFTSSIYLYSLCDYCGARK